MTIPEQDAWSTVIAADNITNSTKNSSLSIEYAPSTFIVGLYRAAGLFDPKIAQRINVQEFTVKDLYELDFYNTTSQRQRPQACQEADPHLSYCQIMGEYRINLKTISTVKPYAGMYERCPTFIP